MSGSAVGNLLVVRRSINFRASFPL